MMKYLIILLSCFLLTAVSSCSEKNQYSSGNIDQQENNPEVVDTVANEQQLHIHESKIQLSKINSDLSLLKEYKTQLTFWIFSIAILIIIFLVIGTLIAYFIFSSLQKRIKKNEQEWIIYKRTLNEKVKELNNAKRDIIQLSQDVKRNSYEKSPIHKEADKLQLGKPSQVIELEVETKDLLKIKDEEFFMSTPNIDGSFNQSSYSKSLKPTASYYRFIVHTSNNSRANFFFVDDEKAVISATDYPQTYIDPTCISENAVNNHAKRILTLEPGIVEKSGDKWVLIKKASIRYE